MEKNINKKKCKECGKDVERTEEESIELGFPPDILNPDLIFLNRDLGVMSVLQRIDMRNKR